jgi:hypothetical protein
MKITIEHERIKATFESDIVTVEEAVELAAYALTGVGFPNVSEYIPCGDWVYIEDVEK